VKKKTLLLASAKTEVPVSGVLRGIALEPQSKSQPPKTIVLIDAKLVQVVVRTHLGLLTPAHGRGWCWEVRSSDYLPPASCSRWVATRERTIDYRGYRDVAAHSVRKGGNHVTGRGRHLSHYRFVNPKRIAGEETFWGSVT